MKLGIDRGASATKGVLYDGKTVVKTWLFEGSIPLDKVLRKIVTECLKEGLDSIPVGVVNITLNGCKKVNPFSALKRGVLHLLPEARTVIEIGGERARLLKIGKEKETEDFLLAERCASGTGLFIEMQANRLGISVEELSRISLKAEKPAKVAGRCAVFAKSDMIHLQQKGVPLEEIAYGLLYAVAVNVVTTLLRGKEVTSPVLIAGGCSKNQGLIKAFGEIMKGVDVVASPLPGFECALGAAILADEVVALETIPKNLKVERKVEGGVIAPLTPVKKERKEEPSTVFTELKRGFVGIDVGSVSTNIAVVDEEGNLLSAVYLPTGGKPIDALIKGFTLIKERFRGGLEVLGACATGSGRYLAQAFLSTDLVKNEISCQMKGTLFYFPNADTIFEIGGQDSKYIYIEKGKLRDFTMNKICAAGTGSFIEEQVSLMGIDVKKDYSFLAFSSKNPEQLCPNCTVFMERTVSSSLSEGGSVEDICAGIAYAVVKNYLERVVGNRKIGKTIVFQGGVASNDAVVSAFEKVLGKEIHVHPYNRISGAIGAALWAKSLVRGKSTFRFPEGVPENMKTFECKRCSNFCDVSVIKIGKDHAFFGDTCERYTSGRGKSGKVEVNLAEEFVKEAEKYFEGIREGRGRIGIPRGSVLLSHLPFWATFFKELGFIPVLSPPSSKEILLKSSKYLQAVTCLPVKFVAGHVASLMESVEHVFLPSLYLFEDKKYTCPYTQSLPDMMKDKEKIIAPVLSMDEDGFLEGFSPYEDFLLVSSSSILSAFRSAMEVQKRFEEKMKKRAEDLTREREKIAVVIGRPYNIYDPYLNLNLFSHLERLGFRAIPMNLLCEVANVSSELPWKFSMDSLKAIVASLKKKKMFPVIISNFGCGPDAFAHKLFEEIIGDYPSLFLEFDEHRGEAGLITRLEAFRDLIEEYKAKEKRVSVLGRTVLSVEELRKKKVYLPYFSDHVYAFSGVLKYAGVDVEVLPLPNIEVKVKGEREASGKECHAYSILLGDLVKLCEREKDEFVYFYPGTKLPCLLHQYSTGMNLFLKKRRFKHAVVYTPVSEEFMKIIGMEGAERFYKALFAIEVLHKIFYLTKPFEKKRGESEKVYADSLLKIEKAVVEGKVYERFKECVERFEEIDTFEEERPYVGVAGDIYTRVNRSANFNLFGELEERGVVAIPSPFEIDIIDYGISRAFFEGLRKGKWKEVFFSAFLLVRKFMEMRKFYRTAGNVWSEPSYSQLKRLAEKYATNPYNELFYLNVGKMVDFAEKGVHGIINATCFNCMVGTASSAVVERVKRDYKIPVITLVYAGHPDPDVQVLLDAFVSEVWEVYRKRHANRKLMTA